MVHDAFVVASAVALQCVGSAIVPAVTESVDYSSRAGKDEDNTKFVGIGSEPWRDGGESVLG